LALWAADVRESNYDPLSRATLPNGLQYANPFPNNKDPAQPVSVRPLLAMQALFPDPNPGNTNLTSNYTGRISGGNTQPFRH
jgi:hypothetical protein